jgi:GT2 family glycosyltransferase
MARNAFPKLTHVLFVDNDVIPPLGALNRLLEHKKPVISAVVPHVKYTNEIGEIYLMAWRKNEDGKFALFSDTGLQKVDAVNAACLLVEIQVFDKIKSPFRFRYNEDGCVNISEEFVFSEKATEAGFGLWTDFDIQCDHHRRSSLLALYKRGKYNVKQP